MDPLPPARRIFRLTEGGTGLNQAFRSAGLPCISKDNARPVVSGLFQSEAYTTQPLRLMIKTELGYPP